MTKITIDLDDALLYKAIDVCIKSKMSLDTYISSLLKEHVKLTHPHYDSVVRESAFEKEETNRYMDKSIALSKLVQYYPCISQRNTTFSSINAATSVFWANPKLDMLKQDWYLILNDKYSKKLYLFFIPAHSINQSKVVVRHDKKNLIDLQIDSDSDFTDTRSKYRFRKHLVETISY